MAQSGGIGDRSAREPDRRDSLEAMQEHAKAINEYVTSKIDD
ncbi:hypothetical protein [Bifidobacterium vansinderenii]|uniref:Uncharacterized protein n=1 Tax=Bifidobacterium vansinderenii TaxID=1984871 RepID=A0A229W189_9BIFI|nr:hypothetical protein [Bifidobacterium vansinderenii]OXN01596.1 hypothetical protein Tam10B_0039 [Bifidobacterium vansinderenii]